MDFIPHLRFLLPPSGSFPALRFISVHVVHLSQVNTSVHSHVHCVSPMTLQFFLSVLHGMVGDNHTKLTAMMHTVKNKTD
jgi:hypothetical protein